MGFVDPNDFEAVAIDTAGSLGGAYVDEIGLTDLSQWSPEQWKEFVSVICAGYVSSLQDQQDKISRAISKINNMPFPA